MNTDGPQMTYDINMFVMPALDVPIAAMLSVAPSRNSRIDACSCMIRSSTADT